MMCHTDYCLRRIISIIEIYYGLELEACQSEISSGNFFYHFEDSIIGVNVIIPSEILVCIKH